MTTTGAISGPSAARQYGAVAACAIAVHLGALANGWALDDVPIVALNPLVAHASGIWRAFAAPYWPPDFGGHMYRPLVIAGFALDRLVDGTAWFHAVNLLWHAAAAVAVAALALRWTDGTGALVAGLLFAVHPVHVEAVANVVGRAEPMAALFTVLAVYAALAGKPAAWSAGAFALGLLSKENAAVTPALVVWAWLLGLDRPDRRRMLALLASWAAVGAAYGVARALVRHPFAANMSVAPMFLGASPVAVRLTAVAALADVARLLVFPLTLRVDYSPDERTLVTSPLDPRFALGLACLLLWAALLVLAWKRGRKLEAFGLGWIGIALLPVSNLLFPAGFYLAERTLYLPSAGVALAAGAALARLPRERLRPVVAAVVVLAGARTAARVPVGKRQCGYAQYPPGLAPLLRGTGPDGGRVPRAARARESARCDPDRRGYHAPGSLDLRHGVGGGVRGRPSPDGRLAAPLARAHLRRSVCPGLLPLRGRHRPRPRLSRPRRLLE